MSKVSAEDLPWMQQWHANESTCRDLREVTQRKCYEYDAEGNMTGTVTTDECNQLNVFVMMCTAEKVGCDKPLRAFAEAALRTETPSSGQMSGADAYMSMGKCVVDWLSRSVLHKYTQQQVDAAVGPLPPPRDLSKGGK